ncbi:Crp/Fnr family transcriptional regulator [Neolewinella sp.]|uniref:Crp/Fnr family transcriptional regulator n=1 Tax=Neolewinella sp. TaxID=2993543 RepID=UPI003B515712
MIPTETYRPIVEQLLRHGARPEDARRLTEQLYRRGYSAKEVVFHEGDRNPPVVYLLSGYLQLYNTNEAGHNYVRILAGPGDFAGCVEGTLYNQPASYTIECVTDCQLAIIDNHLQNLIRQNPEWYQLLQDFILRRILSLSREKEVMLPMKATDRYLYFRERYPQFVSHIPAGVIADYIGVRPQSLSRIKQSLR